MKTSYDIIQKPVISEASIANMNERKYTFRVAKNANKIEIAKAVEEIFKVKVEKVTTMNMEAKKRRVRYKEGKTASWKKAIVKITSDSKSIEFFDSLM